jgi:hypothetical protein
MPASNKAVREDNLSRMIRLADTVFAMKSDPDQLNVNREVREQLLNLHPAAMMQETDENGPVAWLLIIPTTLHLMHQFLAARITEKQLFDMTPAGVRYGALYLCSALVLEEYRRKGIIQRLALQAIAAIRRDHPVQALFVWPFTSEGMKTAAKIARLCELPLFTRSPHSECSQG